MQCYADINPQIDKYMKVLSSFQSVKVLYITIAPEKGSFIATRHRAKADSTRMTWSTSPSLSKMCVFRFVEDETDPNFPRKQL